MFRAAYDALDGASISYKFRIDEEMKGVSSEAIDSVYPQYWNDVREMDSLDEKIAGHREKKDEQCRTMQDMDDYFESD